MKFILSSATLFLKLFTIFVHKTCLTHSFHTSRCTACTFTPFSKLYPGIHACFNMEHNKELNKKVSGKCKQTVDLKKLLEIVEGGFNTQEINSAFDYDIVSSEDESVSLRITSSDESVSGSDNEDVSVIPPTPKKRKMNEFVQINNSKLVATCTKCVNQHVQLASGTNQSNICDLSQQPSLNTVSMDKTSHYQNTGQPDPSLEHDKVPSSNTQHEPVFIIPLDTEVAPE